MTWLSNEVSNGADIAPRIPTEFARVEVREKSDGQKGVFACEEIAAGAVIYRDGGLVVSATISEFPKYGYAVVIDEGLMLAPRDYDKMESIYFLNHNCKPNVARYGGLIYVAKQIIPAGHELSVDYGPLLAGYREDWTMACSCGAQNCRKTITSVDYKNPVLARLLWDEWLPFIQRKIKKCFFEQ